MSRIPPPGICTLGMQTERKLSEPTMLANPDQRRPPLPQRFEQRVIPVDQPVAIAWGDLMGLAKRSGRGFSSIDGLIAATAIAHDLTLATRNIRDFEGFEIELVDPWTERP